jgi:leader peptidase (prepilin peptidase) / N-methyltransferase
VQIENQFGRFLGLCKDAAVNFYGTRPIEFAICAALALTCGVAFGAVAILLVFPMALITLIDHRHFIIPDVLSLPSIVIGLAVASLDKTPLDHATAAVIAASVFWILRFLYQHWRGIEGLGLGDVKLAAAAGAWLGLDALPITCLLATCAALVAVLLRGGDTGPRTAIPFGSFIAPSICLMWLVQSVQK